MDKQKRNKDELVQKRSRSRSPIQNDRRKRYSSSSSSSSEDQAPPPPPKISMSLAKTNSNFKPKGIQIKLNAAPKVTSIQPLKVAPASVFNADESDEEEMPPEAKMRMKNIGKDTPTSSGPNSFGKTKQGFVDSKKIFERKLKQMADELSNKE